MRKSAGELFFEFLKRHPEVEIKVTYAYDPNESMPLYGEFRGPLGIVDLQARDVNHLYRKMIGALSAQRREQKKRGLCF